jgi:hypothetical protein
MTQEQLKFEHWDRVVEACSLAIRHAALLADPAMQRFVEEIIAKDDPKKIRDRKGNASGVDMGLLLALERLSKLRTTNAWVNQRNYFDLLVCCWCEVAEQRDKELRNWERLVLKEAEQAYHAEVVMPLIQQSFETLWAAQAELKKSARNSGLATVSQ